MRATVEHRIAVFLPPAQDIELAQRQKIGEGKEDPKGKTGGKKSPLTCAVRQGFLVFPKGFPLRKNKRSEAPLNPDLSQYRKDGIGQLFRYRLCISKIMAYCSGSGITQLQPAPQRPALQAAALRRPVQAAAALRRPAQAAAPALEV